MKRGALLLTLTAVTVLALLAGAVPASAQSERILNFKSFIKVHPDASMTVTEDISVQAFGQEIKRGIIRDFPTTYRDRLGNTVTVGFKVEEVLRDGRPRPSGGIWDFIALRSWATARRIARVSSLMTWNSQTWCGVSPNT